LLNDWNENHLWLGRSWLDKSMDLDSDRERATRVYKAILRKRFKSYRNLDLQVADFIEDTASLAERMEVYVRKGVADEGIIAEYIGYGIITTYYHLRDILQARAEADDFEYEGFRDLALRIQDYAKLHNKDAGLSDDIVFAVLPPLRYRSGTVSEGC
jgi:hypothetical protein